MFPHTWRQHWSLDEDPFVQEDADKDPVLRRVPLEAVHSSFDRLYGSVEAPGPGVVFGEKGSGKSSLRLAMKRRLDEESAFAVEYIEFDSFLSEARKSDRLPPDGPKTAGRVVERFGLSDHVDAMLSLGITKLVEEVLAGKRPGARGLAPKQKATLLALASLYHHSDGRSGEEVDRGLRRTLRFRSLRPLLRGAGRILGTLLGAGLLAVPVEVTGAAELLGIESAGGAWTWAGGGLLAAVWGQALVARLVTSRRAAVATRAVRVVPPDPDPLAGLLARMPASIRRDLGLPSDASPDARLVLLERFITLLRELGSESFYVLMDRIDEATILSGRAELMRPFIEPLLEHRLLQFEGLALKLFLPIELSRLYLQASADELKSMRLDKANSIPELRWSGHELAEVATQRLRAVRAAGTPLEQPGARLADFFDGEVGEQDIRETLGELGTPRLAFGFLGALFADHARELDDDLAGDSAGWLIPRRRFDVVRASWLDRARGLRRALN